MTKNDVKCENSSKVELDPETEANSKEDECCGNCRFHSADQECRRHAPTGGMYDESHNGSLVYDRWAETDNNEWCGEFEKEVL